MSAVYVLEGWMGDIEWVEGIYADASHAEAVCEELWKHRKSEHAPDWTQGVCKFAVVEHEVIERIEVPA